MKTIHIVGGPTTLIEAAGRRIMTDPTFDPPGRTYRFGWGTGSRQVTGPAFPAERLGRIDAVLLSHDHQADNLDDTGRALLPSAGVVVTMRSGARDSAATPAGWRRGSARRWRRSRPAIEVTAMVPDAPRGVHTAAPPERHLHRG